MIMRVSLGARCNRKVSPLQPGSHGLLNGKTSLVVGVRLRIASLPRPCSNGSLVYWVALSLLGKLGDIM